MFSSYALLSDLSILISLWLLMLWLLLLLAVLLLLLLRRLVLLGFGFSLARKVAGSYYPKNFTPEGNTNKGVAQHSCLTMKWLGPAALHLSVCVCVLCLCMKIECHKIRTIISSAAQLSSAQQRIATQGRHKSLANALRWLFYSSWQKVDGQAASPCSQCPP